MRTSQMQLQRPAHLGKCFALPQSATRPPPRTPGPARLRSEFGRVTRARASRDIRRMAGGVPADNSRHGWRRRRKSPQVR